MSWTTEDLRELMTERSAEAPTPPDRVARAQSLAGQQHRHGLAAGALLTAAVVVAAVAGTAWLANRPAAVERPAPATTITPIPDLVGEQVANATVLEGLRIVTEGPQAVPDRHGRQPGAAFPVVVTVTNQAPQTWSGAIGVGLAGTARDDGSFDNHQGCCQLSLAPVVLQPAHRWSPMWTSGFALPLPRGRHLEGAYLGPRQDITPGQTITFSLWLRRSGEDAPSVPVVGWVPVLNPTDDPTFAMPSLDGYPVVDWAATDQSAPDLPGDRLVRTGDVHGLRITTDGPAVVPFGGDTPTPFAVQVTVTNTGAEPWAGHLGVGLAGTVRDANGYFRNEVFPVPGGTPAVLGPAADSTDRPTTGFARPLPGGRHLEGVVVMGDDVVVGPGQTLTRYIWLVKYAYGRPDIAVVGWVPVLDPEEDDGFAHPSLSGYPEVRWH